MSRSGYDDSCSGWDLIRWRGAVNSAINGKRGQAFLVELRDALDAMPEKRPIADELQADGEFCAIGVLGAKRGVDMSKLVPDDRWAVAEAFGISPAMAAEIVYENDEYAGMRLPDGGWGPETPEHRWQRMRKWVESNIKQVAE